MAVHLHFKHQLPVIQANYGADLLPLLANNNQHEYIEARTLIKVAKKKNYKAQLFKNNFIQIDESFSKFAPWRLIFNHEHKKGIEKIVLIIFEGCATVKFITKIKPQTTLCLFIELMQSSMLKEKHETHNFVWIKY